MPELPEAERARREIEKVLGREIAAVDDRDGYVCRPHAPGEIDAALVGRALTAVHRRGKFLWAETGEAGPELGLHLGMAGRIVVGEEAAAGTVARAPRFAIDFTDGSRLAMFDTRRLSRAVLEPDFSHVGPDAGEVPLKAFAERIGRGTAPVKAALLDQGRVAGVGNLLADEILWQARLSPRRPAGELAEAELRRLHRELRRSIRRAIERGGAHTGDVVPYRTAGSACPRCGTDMERATIGGRTTFWCPVCQT
jgi:formamidopyrimidine-DNA glycosylase